MCLFGLLTYWTLYRMLYMVCDNAYVRPHQAPIYMRAASLLSPHIYVGDMAQCDPWASAIRAEPGPSCA